MNLIIDIGNTLTKVAVFEEDKLVLVARIAKEALLATVKQKMRDLNIKRGIISNVGLVDDRLLEEIKAIFPVLVLNHQTKIPFRNLYGTPHTLGIDRIALIAAATQLYQGSNVLVIDAGTCITYDFLNKENEYLGGAISPGIDIRYRSLNAYTAKLPLLEISEDYELVGNSTSAAIHSGVLNGVVSELDAVIQQYETKYGDLTVVLTGGNANFLVKQLKNTIFANQNFLLFGLNKILTFNNL